MSLFKIFDKMLIIFLTLLFLILSPITIVLFIPIYIYRFIVILIAKLFRSDLGHIVNTRSSVIVSPDKPYESPKWNIVVWLVIEETLNFELFKDEFYKKQILKEGENHQLIDPEYQQYFYNYLGFVFWKWEDQFALEDHMKTYRRKGICSEGELVNAEELKGLVKDLTWRPFKQGKSPWEFIFIRKYTDGPSEVKREKKQCVLIFRAHHGFCDGFSIMRLLLSHVNNFPSDDIKRSKIVERSLVKQIIEGVLFGIKGPYQFMEMLYYGTDRNEWKIKEELLDKSTHLDISEFIDLKCVKEIKKTNRVTFTAVLVAAIAGGIRNHFLEMGKTVPEKMNLAIPLPIPNHPNKLTNHFIFSFLEIPINLNDPKARLLKSEKNWKKLRHSSVACFIFSLVPLIGALHPKIMQWFVKNTYSTGLMSNFPGPTEKCEFEASGNLYKLVDMNFTAGLGCGNVGLGFFIVSVGGGFRIVTLADKNVLPSDNAIKDLNTKIQHEFEILKTKVV